jgi:hypothetical protein
MICECEQTVRAGAVRSLDERSMRHVPHDSRTRLRVRIRVSSSMSGSSLPVVVVLPRRSVSSSMMSTTRRVGGDEAVTSNSCGKGCRLYEDYCRSTDAVPSSAVDSENVLLYVSYTQ